MEEEKLIESQNSPQSLFEKFGGEEGMNTFVNKILDKLLNDPDMKGFFVNTDV